MISELYDTFCEDEGNESNLDTQNKTSDVTPMKSMEFFIFRGQNIHQRKI
jgi:hypothetical protein